MLAIEGPHRFRADAETPEVPAWEIARLLSDFSIKHVGFTSQEEKEYLLEGIDFLSLAIEGRQMARRTILEGKICTNLDAISAFLSIGEALLQSAPLQNMDVADVLGMAKDVLESTIFTDANMQRSISAKELAVTRDLFVSLSGLSLHSSRLQQEY
jgi:hypothetical protein